MTDQMIPAGLTRDEASAVREWAEQALAVEVQDETVVHVARVILAVLPTPPTTTAKENPELPDQTLDDQIRPIVAAMRAAMRRDEHAYPEAKFLADLSGYIKDLEALLPQRPTLADMTGKERSACRWMQCDYAGETSDFTSPGVIGYFDHGDRKAVILTPTCGIVRRDYDRVTNTTPNRAGNVCFVMPAVDGDPRGFTWHICSPNALTYIDQEDNQ